MSFFRSLTGLVVVVPFFFIFFSKLHGRPWHALKSILTPFSKHGALRAVLATGNLP